MYEIKGFKKFKGHDGEPCAQGNLFCDGKKVAEWSDDSWGGPMMLRFVTAKAEKDFAKYAVDYLKQRHAEGKLAIYDSFDEISPSEMTEVAMGQMSYEFEEVKELTRICKKGIAFRIQKEPREVYSVKMPYSAVNVQALKAKYSDIVEIINETLGMPLAA